MEYRKVSAVLISRANRREYVAYAWDDENNRIDRELRQNNLIRLAQCFIENDLRLQDNAAVRTISTVEFNRETREYYEPITGPDIRLFDDEYRKYLSQQERQENSKPEAIA